jgi:hypothetical protein
LQIARVQIDELATPVVALHVDGAYYDVALLEAIWHARAVLETTDFHARVIAARGAGLDLLYQRLAGGDRPTEARLREEDFVPLPPCDGDHAAWLALDVHGEGAEPAWSRRDARQLVGDAQPVAVDAAPRVVTGIAVVLADELWRASAREAERAVLGFTLVVDWSHDGAAQLGPYLTLGTRLRDLGTLGGFIELGGARQDVALGSARFAPAEAIAFASHHHRLMPGDVVGLGGLRPDREVAFGERLSFTLGRARLRGWAVPAPPPPPWR